MANNCLLYIVYDSGSSCIGTGELQHPLLLLHIIDNSEYNESIFFLSFYLNVILRFNIKYKKSIFFSILSLY